MVTKTDFDSLDDFYRQKFDVPPVRIDAENGHFNVFRSEDFAGISPKHVSFRRRDFYKVCLIRGRNLYHYADKSICIDGPTLIFFNPRVPYTWQPLEAGAPGYFCIFSAPFFTDKIRNGLNDLPMFVPGGRPAYLLNQQQEGQVAAIYERMLEEIRSDYQFKFDLLRNYVTELPHIALKSRPSEQLYQHPDAKSRITAVFTELLERQFPIENPTQRFTLRSASDFAAELAVHVNHLNRSVKEVTGKTTTDVIAERVICEAKSLLKHTNWNISEIGYALGFEEPAHFNHFFKKQTRLTPSSFRLV